MKKSVEWPEFQYDAPSRLFLAFCQKGTDLLVGYYTANHMHYTKTGSAYLK